HCRGPARAPAAALGHLQSAESPELFRAEPHRLVPELRPHFQREPCPTDAIRREAGVLKMVSQVLSRATQTGHLESSEASEATAKHGETEQRRRTEKTRATCGRRSRPLSGDANGVAITNVRSQSFVLRRRWRHRGPRAGRSHAQSFSCLSFFFVSFVVLSSSLRALRS